MTTEGMDLRAKIVKEAEGLNRGWQTWAACKDAERGLFFPERGGEVQAKRAKAVCAECPVRKACLEYALVAGEQFGIWGGLAETERKRLRVRRARERRAS